MEEESLKKGEKVVYVDCCHFRSNDDRHYFFLQNFFLAKLKYSLKQYYFKNDQIINILFTEAHEKSTICRGFFYSINTEKLCKL